MAMKGTEYFPDGFGHSDSDSDDSGPGDQDWDDLEVQLTTGKILRGKLLAGSKRDGNSSGKGMGRVRATNEDGRDEVFQLFEARLNHANWGDVRGGDPLAFVVDTRRKNGTAVPPVSAHGRAQQREKHKLRCIWTAVLLRLDDGDEEDGGGFETVVRDKRRAQEQQDEKELKRRVKEEDSITTTRFTLHEALERIRSCKKPPLFRFAYVPEQKFYELANLVHSDPSRRDVRLLKLQLEQAFASIVEGGSSSTLLWQSSYSSHAVMNTQLVPDTEIFAVFTPNQIQNECRYLLHSFSDAAGAIAVMHSEGVQVSESDLPRAGGAVAALRRQDGLYTAGGEAGSADDQIRLSNGTVKFPDHVEREAHEYFATAYSGTEDVVTLITKIRILKDSNGAHDTAMYRCILHSLFDEYRFLPCYPEKELKLTGTIFGQLIQNDLFLNNAVMGLALRHVYEALRNGGLGNVRLFTFGVNALQQFTGRLREWPAYCVHFLSLRQLEAKAPELYKAVTDEWGQVQMRARARGRAANNGKDIFSGKGTPSVRQFMLGIGLKKYLEKLEANEIDLDALALCSDNDYRAMGIPKGPRLKIEHSLKKLKQAKQQAQPQQPQQPQQQQSQQQQSKQKQSKKEKQREKNKARDAQTSTEAGSTHGAEQESHSKTEDSKGGLRAKDGNGKINLAGKKGSDSKAQHIGRQQPAIRAVIDRAAASAIGSHGRPAEPASRSQQDSHEGRFQDTSAAAAAAMPMAPFLDSPQAPKLDAVQPGWGALPTASPPGHRALWGGAVPSLDEPFSGEGGAFAHPRDDEAHQEALVQNLISSFDDDWDPSEVELVRGSSAAPAATAGSRAAGGGSGGGGGPVQARRAERTLGGAAAGSKLVAAATQAAAARVDSVAGGTNGWGSSSSAGAGGISSMWNPASNGGGHTVAAEKGTAGGWGAQWDQPDLQKSSLHQWVEPAGFGGLGGFGGGLGGSAAGFGGSSLLGSAFAADTGPVARSPPPPLGCGSRFDAAGRGLPAFPRSGFSSGGGVGGGGGGGGDGGRAFDRPPPSLGDQQWATTTPTKGRPPAGDASLAGGFGPNVASEEAFPSLLGSTPTRGGGGGGGAGGGWRK